MGAPGPIPPLQAAPSHDERVHLRLQRAANPLFEALGQGHQDPCAIPQLRRLNDLRLSRGDARSAAPSVCSRWLGGAWPRSATFAIGHDWQRQEGR